jgi:sec-independent protein translocase protein TatC
MINFGGKDFIAMLKISEYVSVALKIMIGFGIAFELPVVTYFLAKLGLVTDQTLKEFARYAIVIIFIIAAILTPPDLFSQMAMALPLLLLYGLSILIAKAVNPEKEESSN